jgi:ligand-binding sensor domain-containing protein
MAPHKYLLLFLGLFVSELYGQQLVFNNLSVDLGLPSQESYNVMQDSKGYIWISTEAGLCKYNGTSCKVFNKNNGLPENSTYVVKEDNKGIIWIITSTSRVLYYSGDSLYEAPFSKTMIQQYHGDLSQAYKMAFRDDSIIISTQHETYIFGKQSTSIRHIIPDTSFGYYFLKDKTGLTEIKAGGTCLQVIVDAYRGVQTIGIYDGKHLQHISINYKSDDEPGWRVLTAENSRGDHFIAFDNTLLKINSDTGYSFYRLPQEIISLYCDKQDGLWAGTLKGGVHFYPDTRRMDIDMVNLNGYSVSGISVDVENGVWCSTLEKGIFYSRNKNVISYASKNGLDKPADVLECVSGKIFTATENNELVEINSSGMIRHQLNLKGNKNISDIQSDGENLDLLGRVVFFKTDFKFSNEELIKNAKNNFYSGGIQLTRTDDQRIFGISFAQIFELVDGKAVIRKSPLETSGRCISYIGRNTFLYGCKNGLYEMSLDTIQGAAPYSSKKLNGIDGGVVKIFKSSSGVIWIITKESGLFIFSNGSITNVTATLKLPTERLFDITEDRFGNIWLGSNVGLLCLKPTNKMYDLKIYNTLNGLSSNEIYKVAADSNYIYISTTEGISRFELKNDLTNTIPPLIAVRSLTVNGIRFAYDGNLLFTHDQNSLKVEFDALTFKETNLPSIFFSLRGFNQKNNRQETIKGNILELNNLSPDNYTLSVYAVNNNGVRSTNPVVFHFEIRKPVWQTAWFIISCIVIFIAVVLLAVKLIIGRIRKKEEEKTRINKQLTEFQLTALQAQMNPHFIFNAINSIQNYILKKKEQEAYNYLAKFSKLIRMVLTNSEQKTLTLFDELETINLYVALEQLRFKKNFEYKLSISEEIDIHNFELPTMLIQPYIENAIWHGLMNLPDEITGILKLTIVTENSFLKISIEDNGVGREESKKYKTESVHQPVAMKLTEKRLFIINEMEDYAGAKAMVVDLKDNQGNATGTRVELYLPLTEN